MHGRNAKVIGDWNGEVAQLLLFTDETQPVSYLNFADSLKYWHLRYADFRKSRSGRASIFTNPAVLAKPDGIALPAC